MAGGPCRMGVRKEGLVPPSRCEVFFARVHVTREVHGNILHDALFSAVARAEVLKIDQV